MKAHFLLLITSVIGVTSCRQNDPLVTQQQKEITNITTPDSVEKTLHADKLTEEFSGTVKGDEVSFAHYNFTRYRLIQSGKTTEGELNTERGFGTDRNATVFVLNYEKPEAEQKYFVRFSDGRFVMLDADRKEITGAELTKK